MKRQKITFLLTLLMSMVGISTSAHDFEVDGIYYVYNDGANGSSVSVSYKGNYYYQYYNVYSGSMTIPPSVTNNGRTYSVTSICDYAFYNCSNLTKVTIPNSITNIGNYTFQGCSGLTNVDIPNSVTSIGNSVFQSCSRLTIITIPNSVTRIGDSAFQGCSGITSVTIPNSVTSIGRAFSYMSKLESIKVDPENTVYDSRENCNAIIETKTNTLIAGCYKTAIPDDIKAIGFWAFQGQSKLTSISIPYGVTTINELAFYGTGLSSISLPNSVSEIGYKAFESTPWYDNQPDGLIYVGKVAYKYKGTMPENTSITIKEGTLGIAGWAFNNFNNLVSVTLPNSVTNIGNYAFYRCGFSSITIPQSVTMIGGCVFEGTPWYQSLPDGLVYLNNVLYCDKGLKSGPSVEVKDGTNCISSWAFFGSKNLYSIVIPTSVNIIGTTGLGVFQDCTNLVNVTINKQEPIFIDEWEFTNRSNATLYVPYGCKAAYEAAPYWKEFKEIVEMEPTGVEVTDISQMDNVIYIEPTEGRCGSQATLSVKMKNNVPIQTIQFDLYLPDGVTIVPNEDDELVTASKERINRFNYFESSMQSDGALRLLAQATSTNVPVGDGEICQIVVNIPESMEEGDYPLVIKGALMVENDNTSHSPDPNLVQTKLTVLNYVPGDANNDGAVNAIDFNMIGNYILGQSQSGFNVKAADISGDGDVNAIDFNMVGNMILNGSTASARERRKPTNMEKDNEPQ